MDKPRGAWSIGYRRRRHLATKKTKGSGKSRCPSILATPPLRRGHPCQAGAQARQAAPQKHHGRRGCSPGARARATLRLSACGFWLVPAVTPGQRPQPHQASAKKKQA